MTDFQIHTIDSAPEESKPLLETSQKSFGMIPNLHGVMAESPQALAAYQSLSSLFGATSLSAVERNVVWLTLNVYHRCHYCVPAHTAIAKSQKVPDDVINALREGRSLSDRKLEALRQFTLQVAEKRGEVSPAEIAAFIDAGFTKAQVLDVIVGVAHKVMSNYINHFAHTDVDAAFQAFSWDVPANAAE